MTAGQLIEIVELTPAPAVVLPRKVRLEVLGDEIGAGIRRVEAAVTAAHVPVAGVPFVRYLTLGPDAEVEIGVPLNGSHSVPSLRSTLLPGGPAASIWQERPSSGLHEVFGDLEAWIDRRGEPAGPPWESYWTSPEADVTRTQIVWPMRLR